LQLDFGRVPFFQAQDEELDSSTWFVNPERVLRFKISGNFRA
jgi:hypothetical protein